MGTVDLGERRLLLVLGALAVERADVGGESRLLLGRAVAVLEEHAVGRGRLVVYRVSEEEQELWASVWLVSDVACEQSIHAQVRESRGALHGERAWGSAAQRRRRHGGAWRRCKAAGMPSRAMGCSRRRTVWFEQVATLSF
eukprot:scaffold85781_cov61-Phaeocystis_antarctica.AAC.1